MPKMLSINKDVLTIYDVNMAALWGKENPFVEILRKDIINVGIQPSRNGDEYLMLELHPTAVEKIRQHQAQVPGKLLRIYQPISDNLILLNTNSWLEISAQELSALLGAL